MTWTDYEDVVSRWVSGPFTSDEAQVTTLIADAEDAILREFPKIQDRIDDESLPMGRVQRVVSRMVIRHLINPRGYRSTQAGAGPYQESQTFGGDEPGNLYLTDADKQDLAERRPLKGKAFSVDATPMAARGLVQRDEDVWHPVLWH